MHDSSNALAHHINTTQDTNSRLWALYSVGRKTAQSQSYFLNLLHLYYVLCKIRLIYLAHIVKNVTLKNYNILWYNGTYSAFVLMFPGTMSLVLYRVPGSPPARSVMMLGDLLRLRLEYRDVNLLRNEHKSQEFRKVRF